VADEIFLTNKKSEETLAKSTASIFLNHTFFAPTAKNVLKFFKNRSSILKIQKPASGPCSGSDLSIQYKSTKAKTISRGSPL
jgi:hypothetical protein